MTHDDTSARPMRLALLGCGYAATLHTKSLRALGGKVQRYYASRDRARAEEWNRRHRGSGSFGSYQDAIASDDIDVVAILSPPAYHLDTAIAALRAGKDVIVEKPPFLRAADFDVVEEACRKTGRRVFVAENYFYKPLAVTLRALIAEGVIGDVLFIQINAIKLQRTGDWRDDAAHSGAGALFEGGVHWVNFLANLGLDVASVHAVQPHGPGNAASPMDRSMLVVLQYHQGAVATLAYSWEVPSTLKGVRLSKVYGRKGSILFETNGVFLITNGVKKRFRIPGLRDIQGYKAMFRDFHRAWATGEKPAMDLAIARRDLEIIEAAYRSARAERQPIEIASRRISEKGE